MVLNMEPCRGAKGECALSEPEAPTAGRTSVCQDSIFQ